MKPTFSRAREAEESLNTPVFNHTGSNGQRYGDRHQTDDPHFRKARPRPAMTK
jgi:hypothetical protein